MQRLAREVAVFVHREGQLLLCHRAREDYWHIVSGALELGETPAQAAKRELLEETGLDAVPIDLRLEQRYEVTDLVRSLYAAGTDKVTIGNFHVAAPHGWEPTLNEEHDRYRWATFDVAGPLMYWRETQAAIEILAARLREAGLRRS